MHRLLQELDRLDADRRNSGAQSDRFTFVLVDWTSPRDEPGLAGDAPALTEIQGQPHGDADVQAIGPETAKVWRSSAAADASRILHDRG